MRHRSSSRMKSMEPHLSSITSGGWSRTWPRIQSVTQNTDYGLALKVYVKLDIQEWLKMYSRLYHGCDLQPFENLPTPGMLTIAALVNSEDDMKDPDGDGEIILPHPAIRQKPGGGSITSKKCIESSSGNAGQCLSGRKSRRHNCPNAGHDIVLRFRVVRLMGKGWSQILRFAPTVNTPVTFAERSEYLMIL